MALDKYYLKDEVAKVMEDLLAAAQSRRGEYDVPLGFIMQHVWTTKYLSHFSEANNFMKLAKTNGVQIEQMPENERLAKWRSDRGLKPQIHYRIFVPSEAQIPVREFILLFEEVEGGKYIPCSC